MTALERFEQAFGPSYPTGGYDAIRIRWGATLYFRRTAGERYIARINLQAVRNFPNAALLVAYLRGTEDHRDFRIGPGYWERVIDLIKN